MPLSKSIKEKSNVIWIFYFMFVAVAMATHDGEPIFSTAGPYGWGKMITWGLLIVFLLYSLRCSQKENFFRTMGKIWPYLWFRQVSLDLYIGVFIALVLIYLNEGSLLVTALWFIPMLVMANLATLLYIALNYQSLVANFIT